MTRQQIADEVGRIDHLLAEAASPAGVTVGPYLLFRSATPLVVIRRVLTVVRQLGAAPSLGDVRLPEWLVFGGDLTDRDLEEWLEQWRRATFNDGPPAPPLEWTKENWLHWFEPSNRFWTVVGYDTFGDGGRIFLMLDTEAAPSDALRHLVTCAGGQSIEVLV